MRKTLTITYPADPTRTSAMLADPEYHKTRVSRVGLEDATIEVAPRGQGFVASLSGSVDPSSLPAVAAKIVRSGVSFTVTESWGEPAADGSRTGAYDIDVKGAPVRASATTSMAPQGETTVVTVDLDVSVTVPLVGKTIEEKAAGRIGAAVADEEARAAAWLASH
ncbi:DUF2505 domain-containing protein [Actinomyces slackii]|uniref:Protein of uncharacterized function (DUF2505) n=1 Tax=Actinomyces slackii TaxID=52774 RepID=A0A448KCI9_9ACTO|nr:DUF2505 domain-containing protein [Actinomyces slackii]VEG74654.1 Protein of uncharacterised function (DUF2505) [Actinomyces slackii]